MIMDLHVNNATNGVVLTSYEVKNILIYLRQKDVEYNEALKLIKSFKSHTKQGEYYIASQADMWDYVTTFYPNTLRLKADDIQELIHRAQDYVEKYDKEEVEEDVEDLD